MITPLKQTPCLHCDCAGLELHPSGQVLCKYCGMVNTLPGTVCPRCETVSPTGEEFCENCQRPLFRVCPECQTKNWSGATECSQCQCPLDTLHGLIGRLQEDTDSRLHRQQRESVDLKIKETEASERRLAQLRAIDERREKAQNLALTERTHRERQITTTVAIVAGLALLSALAAIIVQLWPH